MPRRPNTPCQHPGCAALVPYGTRFCEKHKSVHPEVVRSANDRGYNRAWQRARREYLNAHPLCVKCMEEGQYQKATVVDHIIPHRGDQKLFWDRSNWQALCKRHHDIKTGNEDSRPVYRY